MKKERVAILGASDNPERYSYKAFKMLSEHGHETVLVAPRLEQVEGHKVYTSLKDIGKVDTLTMYVGKKLSDVLSADILALETARVIFNPGAENEELSQKLKAKGISVENACTLVLLRTNQF
ncbi:MAG: CoA-binding protein [Bacteriovoracaceae bacterium]|nr:CoA-binding protein [Bacteriovoracaceae bacterium]